MTVAMVTVRRCMYGEWYMWKGKDEEKRKKVEKEGGMKNAMKNRGCLLFCAISTEQKKHTLIRTPCTVAAHAPCIMHQRTATLAQTTYHTMPCSLMSTSMLMLCPLQPRTQPRKLIQTRLTSSLLLCFRLVSEAGLLVLMLSM